MKLNFNNSFAKLPNYFYTKQQAEEFSDPYLIHANKEVAKLLDLKISDLKNSDFAQYFSGQKLLKGSDPIAMVYAGHQFGHYVPQLGDGRALTLGEVVNKKNQRFDIQLKGAGKTPFSRMGDGFAVLRSVIREYLCSEAMFNLGIPTSRALCIVGTNEKVNREEIEQGAILTRVWQSNIRFGTFEFFHYQKQYQAVQELADYVLQRHYPQQEKNADGYYYMFEQAVINTAEMIAKWQAVGFCHGVMNTDNMSILGITIDYGPFGFFDNFDANHICNSSDYSGRYSYNNQPTIAFWNLLALAQSLESLVAQSRLKIALDLFQPVLIEKYSKIMRAKLGFSKVLPEDEKISQNLFVLLQKEKPDYTIFFRKLGDFVIGGENAQVRDLFENKILIDEWLAQYSKRLELENLGNEERKKKMNLANPKYILRNYLLQNAIEKAQIGDFSEIDRLYQIYLKPFDEQKEFEDYAKKPPKSAFSIKVSCSS